MNIEELARQAGLRRLDAWGSPKPPPNWWGSQPELERFAALVRNEALEEAAQVTAGSVSAEITRAMINAGRAALLSSFPEDVLSERTAGLNQAVRDIFEAMQVAFHEHGRETSSMPPESTPAQPEPKDGMPVALHLLTPQQLLPIWQERNGPGIPMGWANIYEFFVDCVQRFPTPSPEPQPRINPEADQALYDLQMWIEKGHEERDAGWIRQKFATLREALGTASIALTAEPQPKMEKAPEVQVVADREERVRKCGHPLGPERWCLERYDPNMGDIHVDD